MTVKVAINGFGRIGRAILRANFELEPEQRKIQIVAINDLASPEANAHLTEFDSTHGRFGKVINVFKDAIEIEGEKIQMYSEKNPLDLSSIWLIHLIDFSLINASVSGVFLEPGEIHAYLIFFFANSFTTLWDHAIFDNLFSITLYYILLIYFNNKII